MHDLTPVPVRSATRELARHVTSSDCGTRARFQSNARLGQCSGMTPERRLPFSCRTHPCGLDVFGKTEAAGQRGVGEEGDLIDLAAAQGEHHHAPRLRAQVVAEGRLAVGAGRAYL